MASHPRREHRWRDLRLEPRQHDGAAVARRRVTQRPRKAVPVETVRVADPLAGERAVLEAHQRHVVAGRRAEHVTRARRVDPLGPQQPEQRIARAEGDGDPPGGHEPHADEAARVVAAPGDHVGGRQAVALHPVARQPADHRPGRGELGKLAVEPRRRGAYSDVRPSLGREIHQVHARAVSRLGRRVRPDEQRRQERAHQVNPVGRRIARRVLLVVLANLGSREPLERPGSGQAGERVRSPDGAGDGGALRRGARVHPDRRLRATQHAAQLSDERLPRIEPRESRRRGAVQINAAVLLRRTRHGPQPAEIEPRVPDQDSHESVQRFAPKQRRRRRDQRIGVRQDAAASAVVGKIAVEVERSLKHDATLGSGYLEHDPGQALSARVETQIQGHAGYARSGVTGASAYRRTTLTAIDSEQQERA